VQTCSGRRTTRARVLPNGEPEQPGHPAEAQAEPAAVGGEVGDHCGEHIENRTVGARRGFASQGALHVSVLTQDDNPRHHSGSPEPGVANDTPETPLPLCWSQK
jgi:hypothetical protein